MAYKYLYNSKEYRSTYELRQEIWSKDNKIFDNPSTKEQWAQLNVEMVEYDPLDQLTDNQYASMIRSQRDSKLAQCDYYVATDYPSNQQSLNLVKQYRQALRDVTKQVGFPRNVVWPQVPIVLQSKSQRAKKNEMLAKVGI